MAPTAEPIVLASASTARAALLRAAGVDFSIEPATVDEARLKRGSRWAGESAIDCARSLANAKAHCISIRHPTALVIGADQILASGSISQLTSSKRVRSFSRYAAGHICWRPRCALRTTGSRFGVRRARRN
jgi:Maf-like protein